MGCFLLWGGWFVLIGLNFLVWGGCSYKVWVFPLLVVSGVGFGYSFFFGVVGCVFWVLGCWGV